MGSWNLPDNTWDGDPDAPWNQPDGHCSCCPAHEDRSEDEPLCEEGGVAVSECNCWVYVLAPFYGRGFLPWDNLVRRFGHMKWTEGLFPSFCEPREEPLCACDECTCKEDAAADYADYMEDRKREERMGE